MGVSGDFDPVPVFVVVRFAGMPSILTKASNVMIVTSSGVCVTKATFYPPSVYTDQKFFLSICGAVRGHPQAHRPFSVYFCATKRSKQSPEKQTPETGRK